MFLEVKEKEEKKSKTCMSHSQGIIASRIKQRHGEITCPKSTCRHLDILWRSSSNGSVLNIVSYPGKSVKVEELSTGRLVR